MNSEFPDLAAIINRFLERAAQNLTIESLLIQLHLDPNNITFDAILNRLIELTLVNTTIPNMCALIAAGFYAATFLMRTMVPLRICGIISALFFMAYGALGGVTTYLFDVFVFAAYQQPATFPDCQSSLRKRGLRRKGIWQWTGSSRLWADATTAKGISCFGKGS